MREGLSPPAYMFMKQYPSFTGKIVNKPIYAFDKLDGSNVRAEWSRKKGFHKFGTRKRLLGDDEYIVGKTPALVKAKYGKDLNDVFSNAKFDRVVCFFEFFGENSFAGWHDPNDNHDIVLFDISVDKKGILEPKKFIKMCGHLDVAKLLYRGNPNSEFIDSVKNGTLEGMSHEGVVCKGSYKSPGLPLMFKVKNLDWVKKLRERCGDDITLFEERS